MFGTISGVFLQPRVNLTVVADNENTSLHSRLVYREYTVPASAILTVRFLM